MHTCSPAKMRIGELSIPARPLCHLHAQFHRDIPYADSGMDYMNLHQSAREERGFGHICAKLGVRRRVIVRPRPLYHCPKASFRKVRIAPAIW